MIIAILLIMIAIIVIMIRVIIIIRVFHYSFWQINIKSFKNKIYKNEVTIRVKMSRGM